MNYAKELLQKKQFKDALNLYKDYEKNNTNIEEKAIAALNASICLFNLEQNEEALFYVNKAITHNPQYIKAYYRKAQILTALQSYNEALQIVENLQSKQPCKEVDDLKNHIKQAYCDPLPQLRDLEESSTEKDIIRAFNELYMKAEYMEKNFGEGEFFHKLFNIENDKILLHRLKYTNYMLNNQEIPDWLQIDLIQKSKFYESLDNSKKDEIQLQFLRLFSRIKFRNDIFQLIMDNPYFYLEKYLEHITKLFIHNKNCIPLDIKFINYIAAYIKKEVDYNSEQFSLIIELIILMIQQQIVYFDFLKRDTFRQQDLIILLCMAASNQIDEVMKEYDISLKLINTIKKKEKKLKTIDIINQILLITRKQLLAEKINNDCSRVVPDLVEYIKEYKQNYETNVKYLCLLCQLQSQSNYLQLYEYITNTDCEMMLQHLEEDIEINDSLILMGFISTFDEIKKLIMNDKEKLKQFSNRLQFNKSKSSYEKLRFFQHFIAYLEILRQLSSDVSLEYKEKQKQNFEIDDETYEMAKQISKQYKQDQTDQYLTYNMQYILDNRILRFIAIDLQTLSQLSIFIHDYRDWLDDNTIMIIIKLLKQFTFDETLNILDKNCLQIAAQAIMKGNQEAITYLSKVMMTVNPQLFNFKEAQQLSEALFQAASIAQHELLQFQSLMGIVQLTALGDYICEPLIIKKHYQQLQNYLLDANQYIVHASLQILNNIAQNQKFLDLVDNNHLDKMIHIIIMLFKQYHSQEEITVKVNDFSHPKLIINTIISLLAIISVCDSIPKILKQEINIIYDKQFQQSIIKADSQMDKKVYKILNINQFEFFNTQGNIKYKK